MHPTLCDIPCLPPCQRLRPVSPGWVPFAQLDVLIGRKWHASQKLDDHPTGGLTMTMTLNNLEEVTRWILSFGKHATVIQPPELRERVGRIGRELANRYPGA